MTDRLTRSLVQSKLAAVAMDSATTDDRELHPTVANGEEMKRQECDYLVLTQVRDPKINPTEPRLPPISIGGRTPSTDASDPLGGHSGPVYRDNLEIDFALFRAETRRPRRAPQSSPRLPLACWTACSRQWTASPAEWLMT